MDTKKLESLIAAAELGSFTKAAQILGYTQSGLTHMMKSLEQEMGVQLLVRSHTGISLSPAGKQLLPTIRRLLDAEKALQQELEQLQDARRESLRIGSYSSMAMHWLPLALKRFQQDHPGVNINVRMGTIEEIYSWVQDGTADLAFVSRQEGSRMKWIPLKEDKLVAILPPDYPGPIPDKFPLSGFQGQPFLMPNFGFERDINKCLRAYGVEPDVKPSYVDDPVLISMVEHGLGMSMLSELIMTGRESRAHVLPTDPPIARSLGIILDESRPASPLAMQFIKCAKEALSNAGML
jgi:DNA-binding transcriptional LysR family regulator